MSATAPAGASVGEIVRWLRGVRPNTDMSRGRGSLIIPGWADQPEFTYAPNSRRLYRSTLCKIELALKDILKGHHIDANKPFVLVDGETAFGVSYKPPAINAHPWVMFNQVSNRHLARLRKRHDSLVNIANCKDYFLNTREGMGVDFDLCDLDICVRYRPWNDAFRVHQRDFFESSSGNYGSEVFISINYKEQNRLAALGVFGGATTTREDVARKLKAETEAFNAQRADRSDERNCVTLLWEGGRLKLQQRRFVHSDDLAPFVAGILNAIMTEGKLFGYG